MLSNSDDSSHSKIIRKRRIRRGTKEGIITNKRRTAWFLATLLLVLPSISLATGFSKLVVFGDSLSDNGNLFAASGGRIPSRYYYYRGRYSNGPVWPEFASSILGIKLIDLAYSGAQSNDRNALGNYPGLSTEIDRYLQETGGILDSKALYIVWAAANDLMYAGKSVSLSALTEQLVGNIRTAATRLERAGARFIVVPLMADLGIIPWATSSASAFSPAEMTAASKRFNRLLAASLKQQLPAALTLDVMSLHTDWTSNPSDYGFRNVSFGCLSLGCSDPDKFLYWDDRHPTSKAHESLAKAIVAELERFPARSHSFGLFLPSKAKYLLSEDRRADKAHAVITTSDGVGTKPLAGDWNGDKRYTVGSYTPTTGLFRLADSNRKATTYQKLRFGPKQPALLPVAGDWNGDGRQTVGIYDSIQGKFYLRLSNDQQTKTRLSFRFGPKNSTWLPVAGDWNGDGIDTVGLYKPDSGRFVLKNVNKRGRSGTRFVFGAARSNSKPLAGDWNGDGYSTIGVYDAASALFLLKDSNAFGSADYRVEYGEAGVDAYPVTGDWDGSESD